MEGADGLETEYGPCTGRLGASTDSMSYSLHFLAAGKYYNYTFLALHVINILIEDESIPGLRIVLTYCVKLSTSMRMSNDVDYNTNSKYLSILQYGNGMDCCIAT